MQEILLLTNDGREFLIVDESAIKEIVGLYVAQTMQKILNNTNSILCGTSIFNMASLYE